MIPDKKLEKPIELTEDEIQHVAGAAKPNQNAGGGPGNSRPGDKTSPVKDLRLVGTPTSKGRTIRF
jgi:hypothetical protein